MDYEDWYREFEHKHEKQKFGERLKYARKKSGFSQEDLSRSLNVALGTVRNWEQGRRYPDVAQLQQIAVTLNVSADYLVVEGVAIHKLEEVTRRLFTWNFIMYQATVASIRLPEDKKKRCDAFVEKLLKQAGKMGSEWSFFEPAALIGVLRIAIETGAPILVVWPGWDEKELGKKVRLLREYAGLAISEVAQKIGVKDSLVSDMEAGVLYESGGYWELENHNLALLVKLFGITIEALLDTEVKIVLPQDDTDSSANVIEIFKQASRKK